MLPVHTRGPVDPGPNLAIAHKGPELRHFHQLVLRLQHRSAENACRGNPRNFHQLFRHLRLANHRSHRDINGQDLGHFDNLLGTRREHVEEMQEIWQLFHHLRHRIIESRQRRDKIEDLLHSAPLFPFLRSGHGKQAVRPHLPGLFFVEAEELRLGSGGGSVWGVRRRRRGEGVTKSVRSCGSQESDRQSGDSQSQCSR